MEWDDDELVANARRIFKNFIKNLFVLFYIKKKQKNKNSRTLGLLFKTCKQN